MIGNRKITLYHTANHAPSKRVDVSVKPRIWRSPISWSVQTGLLTVRLLKVVNPDEGPRDRAELANGKERFGHGLGDL